jgi:hypothetical protein
MSANKLTKVSKDLKQLPSGAKVLSKETSIWVEEIENGFLITKSTEIKHERPSTDKNSSPYTDWTTITKKWFSKEDPFIDMDDVPLAESFKE